MSPGLERPDSVVLPSVEHLTEEASVSSERQIPHIVEYQPMADIEDRVPTIQLGFRKVGCESVAGGVAVGGSRAAMPSRAIVNRMAPRVVQVEKQAMAGLLLKRELERVVIRIRGVLPDS